MSANAEPEDGALLARIVELGGAFTGLDASIADGLQPPMRKLALAEGELLFEVGQPSDGLYVLLAGSLEAAVPAEGERLRVGVMRRGDAVGEIQALTGAARTAWVTALEACELVHLPEATLRALLAQHPEIEARLGELGRSRLRRQQLAAILTRRFGSVDVEALRRLESEVSWRRLPRGERLFRQGDPGDALFIAVSGRLRALTEGDPPKRLGEIARGESLGEMALLAGAPRSASVYALRDSELAAISRNTLERLVGEHPQLLFAITRSLLERLDERTRLDVGEEGPAHIAILPLDAQLPTSAFAERLATALRRFGAAAHLSASNLQVDPALRSAAQTGEAGMQGFRLEAWLTEQEAQHRFVLYEAQAHASPWTQRCIRQADHVLLLADAASEPGEREIERDLLDAESPHTAPSCTLVLLHRDPDSAPRDTARWLAPRTLLRHHRVRWQGAQDLERLARFLAHRAVGVVLGGGGARAAAHIGVLKALDEAGIPIDAIGGTSGGAIVAAHYAMGKPHDVVLDDLRRSFGDKRFLRSVTLPLVSLVSPRKLEESARQAYGETRIEDLWRDFFCVSCDLVSGEPVAHRRGSLWRAVRASTSLPGIVPPLPEGERLLVDGGVLDNLPHDTMHEICRGFTLVSDVSAQRRLNVGYSEVPSAARILASWAMPGRTPIDVPTLSRVIARVCAIASVARRDAAVREASFAFVPPVQEYGLLDFDAVEPIAERAYEYAVRALADWPEREQLGRAG